jgi:UPF0176 protein
MNKEKKIAVAAFYKFVEISAEELQALIVKIRENADQNKIKGLILLALEGINATVAGKPDAVNAFKAYLWGTPQFKDMIFKDSFCDRMPFRRLAVKERDEIVTLKTGIGIPHITQKNRLEPQAWNQMLKERAGELALIDVRNDYEVELGKFRGAIDPKIKKFSDFPEFVAKSGIAKDKPVLMYCTGGIRCEKAIEEMYSQGYKEVYQLDGGILRYLEECPDGEYEGECFVFDHRVAVDKDLQPSTQYKLCPHCGDPGSLAIECGRCHKHAVICRECAMQAELNSCSKNCSYHLGRQIQSPQQENAHS